MDKITVKKIKEKLSLILNDSYVLCDHSDKSISFAAERINRHAYEAKKLMDRFPGSD